VQSLAAVAAPERLRLYADKKRPEPCQAAGLEDSDCRDDLARGAHGNADESKLTVDKHATLKTFTK